jgi:hypothetical protein
MAPPMVGKCVENVTIHVQHGIFTLTSLLPDKDADPVAANDKILQNVELKRCECS